MVCLWSRSIRWAVVAPGLSSSRQGAAFTEPNPPRRTRFRTSEALFYSIGAEVDVVECSNVQFCASQPTLHSAISSSPVVAGFINDGPGFELQMVSLLVLL